MQASLFYANDSQGAIPLIIIPEHQATVTSAQFQGKYGQVHLVTNKEGHIEKAYIGGGEGDDALAMAHAALKLPPATYTAKDISEYAILVWALAQYQYDQFKKSAEKPRVLYLSAKDASVIESKVRALFFTRDLINTPANILGPEELGKHMEDLARRFDARYEAWVGDDLLAANFPAIHAVGRASSNAPRLLRLQWGDASHPKVSLIGKGVCFDSGGLNIKPAEYMRCMKKDMGGAAHALGLAQWIMTNKLPISLEVLIPAVDNMIGPNAFKPGDVLTMRNKLTVEIDNTDAEGRLVLADALVFASERKPELMIDISTLTGAARVALGVDIAAMFCNDDAVAKALLEASLETNDPMWQLPLFAAYAPMLHSNIADLCNSSSSNYAGAITAALFLQRFLPAKTAWVHCDIMAWNPKAKPGKPEGGEALGLRALMAFLQKKYA